MWGNTNEMKYNLKKLMYILEVEHALNELGLDFVEKEGSETKARDRLYQISRTVYNWIYAHTTYKKYMEYELAMNEKLRPIILNVLEEQARYEFEMSAEYFSMQTGVNVVSGTIIPVEKFRGVLKVAPAVDDILRNEKLLFQGQRPFINKTYDYERDGY